MTTDNLRSDLDALPGVATAEIVLRDDDNPVARIWLDGTRDDDEVRELVDAVLGQSISSVVFPSQTTQRRRIGLGRGLGDLISNDEHNAVPVQLQPTAGQRPSITRVAIIESARGVVVEIEDGAGDVHSEPVGDEGTIDEAVLTGVLALVDGADDSRLDVTDVETGDGIVLLVTAIHDDRRSVGAAFIEFGRPYALARAGIDALCGL